MKPPPDIDAAMLARARRGDMRAHAALYRALAPGIYTLARRMLASAAAAEDVLQDTFVEVIRGIADFRGEAGVATWVRRIAINKCLAQLRSGWHTKRDGAASIEALAARETADGAGEHGALERALEGLSDAARAVVWLHDVEGYTHEEIGRLMGRTPSFSKSQLARAHERLRGLLEGHEHASEIEPCVGALKTC